jgi:hypothetical protein
MFTCLPTWPKTFVHSSLSFQRMTFSTKNTVMMLPSKPAVRFISKLRHGSANQKLKTKRAMDVSPNGVTSHLSKKCFFIFAHFLFRAPKAKA